MAPAPTVAWAEDRAPVFAGFPDRQLHAPQVQPAHLHLAAWGRKDSNNMKSTLQAGLRHIAKSGVSRGNVEPVCRTTHNRFIVEVAIGKRLAGKSAKAGLA
jgi:hypothetical protein